MSLSSKRIMVVDDSTHVRILVRRILEREECEVFEAGNGREAISMLEESKVDMVITDLAMPVMDGVELIKKIRADKSYGSLPILVFTAEGQEWIRVELEKYDVRAWVLKPFDKEYLLEEIKAALN